MKKTALAGFVSLFIMVQAGRADEWTKKFTVSGKPDVKVETDDGDVTVRAGEAKVIEARVETVGWRISPDEVRVTDRQSGDRVELEVRLPRHHGGFGHRSIKIDLTVPLELNADFRTGDGNVSLQGVRGETRVTTGDGNVEAQGLDGIFEASTGDGNVRVSGRFDRLSIKSGDGRIAAEINSGSKMASDWSVRSGDGDVELRLPEGFAADVDLHTGDGHIDVDVPITASGAIGSSEIRGKMNGGGLTLRVHTGDGSIRVGRL